MDSLAHGIPLEANFMFFCNLINVYFSLGQVLHRQTDRIIVDTNLSFSVSLQDMKTQKGVQRLLTPSLIFYDALSHTF